MILDTSAVVALVLRERGHERLLEAVSEAEWVGIGAPTWAETGIVLAARLGPEARLILSLLTESLDLRVLPFEGHHAREAREAFERYGRGRHPAALNFGDCLSYATARVAGETLLFVGDDFSQTDVQSAAQRNGAGS